MAASLTILLITPERVVRADFTGGSSPRPAGLWVEEAPPTDLVSAVETALWLGPGKVKRVWVLSTDVWTQTLSLPQRAVAGLSVRQVARALAYEAEPVSGIAATDASTGYRELGREAGDQRYWLSKLPSYELNQIVDTVGRVGGRLMGVAHPAGLGEAGGGGDTGQARVELWPGQVVFDDGAGLVELAPADPRTTAWTSVAPPGWATPDRVSRVIVLTCSTELAMPVEPQPDTYRQLGDEAVLAPWLTACAAALSTSNTPAPVVRPEARPMTAQRRGMLTLALLAAALLLCIGHYAIFGTLLGDAQARVNELEADARRAAGDRSQATKANAQLKQLTGDTAYLRRQIDLRENTLAAHRGRWTHLLTLLSLQCDGDLIVNRIEQQGYDLKVSGLCLSPQMADALATTMQDKLSPWGWQVQPATKRALMRAEGGGPWAFELSIKDSPVITRPGEASDGQLTQGQQANGGRHR